MNGERMASRPPPSSRSTARTGRQKRERPHNSALDSGKFLRDFGFAMPQWRSSLAEVVGRLAKAA